jgi:hypothetical protein
MNKVPKLQLIIWQTDKELDIPKGLYLHTAQFQHLAYSALTENSNRGYNISQHAKLFLKFKLNRYHGP